MDDHDGGGHPLFSVVIPTYQRERTVLGSIDSVLAQTFHDLELIVADDGSTDGTRRALGLLEDPRLRVLHLDHGGVCAARNAGIAAASGTYVAFLDSDDRAQPDWLSTLATEIRPFLPPLVRCGATIVDERSGRASVATPAEGPALYPYGVCLPGTYAISRRLLQRVGGFEPRLRFGENTELLIRVLALMATEGAAARLIDTPLVTCMRRRRRAPEYGDGPAQAATHILRIHRSALRDDRQLLADHLAIVGTAHLRARRRRRAASSFARAWLARPSARGLGRLTLPLAPGTVIDRRADPDRISVVIACPGAGRIRRGYETFAEELARQLQPFGDLDVHLLQGGPATDPWTRRIAHLDQGGRAARLISRVARTKPKYVEHISFGLAALPLLLWLRPHVVVVSEHALASILHRARALPGLRHRLVFNNGGLNRPPLPEGFDVVQEVTQHAVENALSAGFSSGQHVLLPLGVDTRSRPPTDRRLERRQQLGLPGDRSVVITVGQLDATLKRMDQVIRAVAAAAGRPYLVLLGQRTDETPALERLAHVLLGPDGAWFGTVDPDDVRGYYEAADLFVLASGVEGFGRVYIEALSAGLACVVHDYPVAREVCGPHATFVDCTDVDTLCKAVMAALGMTATQADRERRWRWAHDHFSWELLADRYHDRLVEWARGVVASASVTGEPKAAAPSGPRLGSRGPRTWAPPRP